MQTFLFPERQADLKGLKNLLQAGWGKVRDEVRLDPTSQFVLAFIGSRTYDDISARAFVRLRARYGDWDSLANAVPDEIAKVLADVTHAEAKAVSIKGALRKIRACAGRIELDFLADLPVDVGLCWLENIYGVGRKIAAATLNFSTLRKRAFVVDTHVLRVMRRYGFVAAHADTVAVYEAVMASADDLDADALYELHWLLKSLGQKCCTHSVARCHQCLLSDICRRRLENAAESGRSTMRRG